jgi:hypothetical protein
MKDNNNFKEINSCHFELKTFDNSLRLRVPIILPNLMRSKGEEFFYFNKENVKELMDYLNQVYEIME